MLNMNTPTRSPAFLSARSALSARPLVALSVAALLGACSDSRSESGTANHAFAATGVAESCMSCHNGSQYNDYAGPGLENPHPFTGAATLRCTACHGGNPMAMSMADAHVPPPPQVGDREFQRTNARAYFNRLTLAGMDKYPDYMVNGVTHTALEYLRFINPGDLRVTTSGRGCGECHMAHSQSTARAPLATEMGIFSNSAWVLGVDLRVSETSGLYGETGSDMAFRATTDPNYVFDPAYIGPVSRMTEFPVYSVFGRTGGDNIFNNPAYLAANLPNSVNANGSLITNSPLANLFHEQVAFTCGDCHLGSAGANNRYGDFRSSGCTACHMRYSQDGKSRLSDPNINKTEPVDPDDIDEPERPHVLRHQIASVHKTLPGGATIAGIDDHACAGCHQGSNRTVLQYWGIRLDQNADVVRREQYPANPTRFQTTATDTRLYDPQVANNTFNGRNHNQYLLFEDYDGDRRDDTPEDVHYAAGLGCIDCHGSHDVHGGAVGDPSDSQLVSRQEQAIAIRCESCHGTVDAYALTTQGVTYDGRVATLAKDVDQHALRHVIRESDNEMYLYSRLDGRRHYVKQTRDVVVNNGKRNPLNGELVYNAKASYAMGRVDNDPSNGIGPQQTGVAYTGFSHTDTMTCVACHASWSNNCIGCHLKGEYNTGNNFSNITGERIVYRQTNADFTYQTPVPFQLGVSPRNMISVLSPNTEAFYQYRDSNGDFSQVFTFTDRNGNGSSGGTNGRNPHPALSHNTFTPHSIRGKVSGVNEGPRYCVACHLTTTGVSTYRTQFDAFKAAMDARNYGALDFNLLKQHIGQNTGNRLNSPIWVHMVSGLGSGAFLFAANGCPENPLDDNANRIGCDGVAPNAVFDPSVIALNLDRVVEPTGVSNASNSHLIMEDGAGVNLRDGALDPANAGPLGATLIRKLSDPDLGVVLDSWIDADGNLQGGASTYVP